MEKIIKNWIFKSNIPDYQKKYVYYYLKYNISELNEFKVQRKSISIDENSEEEFEIFIDLQKPLIYSPITGAYIGYYTGNEEKGYKYYIFIKK